MRRGFEFLRPRERLELAFPPDITTDAQRVLYALWGERVQSLDRLWLLTGVPPMRLIKAVKELAGQGRIRADAVEKWLEDEDWDPDSEPGEGLRSSCEVQKVFSGDVSMTR